MAEKIKLVEQGFSPDMGTKFTLRWYLHTGDGEDAVGIRGQNSGKQPPTILWPNVSSAESENLALNSGSILLSWSVLGHTVNAYLSLPLRTEALIENSEDKLAI